MRAAKIMGLVMAGLTLLITVLSPTILAAKPAASLKAAFVRGGDLWIKNGNVEQQLTKGEYIRNPKWSFDGEWIAYVKGKEEQELRLWHVPTGQSRLVSPERAVDYLWSPEHNHLAFLVEQKLYVIHADKPGTPAEAAEGLSNFSWLPNGKGFVASTTAELLPSGWTQVKIVEIPLTWDNEPQAKTLYVLPKQSSDFFAVGTSVFKFSATGKWIAFLATPTASLSADSNTLCILSADGTMFNTVDLMANNEEWFNWADRGDTLAYIGGVGREATSNKQLRVLKIPASGKPVSYTPAGYVDQSFTWEGVQHIVVSRAAERKGTDGSATNPLPKLFEINLQGQRSKTITKPPRNYGDFYPQYLRRADQLAWVRSDRSKANVFISGRSGKQPSIWITNIDLGATFYEQWRWSDVLSFYTR